MSKAWGPGPLDRITADDLGIDEIVLTGVTVHLERMDTDRYYLGIHDPSGSDLLVQVSISHPAGVRRRYVTAHVYEMTGADAVPVEGNPWELAKPC